MFTGIIKSYQEESIDIIKGIYEDCADSFQGRHYEKNYEFIQNTPANMKIESLCKVLNAMIGGNKKLRKVSAQMLDCFNCMYAFTQDLYYICGLKDSANITDIRDIETHIEKMLLMHKSKAYENFRIHLEDYEKTMACFEMCKEQIVKELGEDATKVISDIEAAEHEKNETEVIIDYIGGIFDAKLIVKFINDITCIR
jgi:hypothetical protein